MKTFLVSQKICVTKLVNQIYFIWNFKEIKEYVEVFIKNIPEYFKFDNFFDGNFIQVINNYLFNDNFVPNMQEFTKFFWELSMKTAFSQDKKKLEKIYSIFSNFKMMILNDFVEKHLINTIKKYLRNQISSFELVAALKISQNFTNLDTDNLFTVDFLRDASKNPEKFCKILEKILELDIKIDSHSHVTSWVLWYTNLPEYRTKKFEMFKKIFNPFQKENLKTLPNSIRHVKIMFNFLNSNLGFSSLYLSDLPIKLAVENSSLELNLSKIKTNQYVEQYTKKYFVDDDKNTTFLFAPKLFHWLDWDFQRKKQFSSQNITLSYYKQFLFEFYLPIQFNGDKVEFCKSILESMVVSFSQDRKISLDHNFLSCFYFVLKPYIHVKGKWMGVIKLVSSFVKKYPIHSIISTLYTFQTKSKTFLFPVQENDSIDAILIWKLFIKKIFEIDPNNDNVLDLFFNTISNIWEDLSQKVHIEIINFVNNFSQDENKRKKVVASLQKSENEPLFKENFWESIFPELCKKNRNFSDISDFCSENEFYFFDDLNPSPITNDTQVHLTPSQSKKRRKEEDVSPPHTAPPQKVLKPKIVNADPVESQNQEIQIPSIPKKIAKKNTKKKTIKKK